MTTLESAAEAIARPAVGFTRSQTLAVRLWAPLMFMGLILSAAAFILVLSTAWLPPTTSRSLWRSARQRPQHGHRGKEDIHGIRRGLAPGAHFLGIGLVLASVLQLFTIILGSLRVSGATVQQSLVSP